MNAISLGYFPNGRLVQETQSHQGTLAAYSLGYRPGDWPVLNRAEWGLSWYARNHSFTDTLTRTSDTTSTLGDFRLILKTGIGQSKPVSLAVHTDARLYTAEEGSFLDIGSFSPSATLLTSVSLKPLVLHFNAGYRIDNSEKVFRSLDPYPSRGIRAAEGIDGENRILLGLGTEFRSRRVTPFMELTTELDADSKARNSDGEIVKLNFTQNPIRLTPGIRVHLGAKGTVKQENVPEGRHRITIRREGYIEKTIEIEVPAEKTKKIKVALVPVPKVELKEEKIEINQRVQFYFNTSDIREESLPILQEVAELVKAKPELRVQVEGHTDATGTADVNLQWSEARARAVVDYFVQQGVDAERLTAKGVGAEKPVAPNDTPEGRRANRRVEFMVVKDDPEATVPASLQAGAAAAAPHPDQPAVLAAVPMKWAVVIAPKGTSVFRAKGAKRLKSVRAGWRGEFMRLSGPWAEVRLEDGSTGWIHGNDIRVE